MGRDPAHMCLAFSSASTVLAALEGVHGAWSLPGMHSAGPQGLLIPAGLRIERSDALGPL